MILNEEQLESLRHWGGIRPFALRDALDTIADLQRQLAERDIRLEIEEPTNGPACSCLIAEGIVCGEPREAHTLEAAKADVAMDHDFTPGTWDAPILRLQGKELAAYVQQRVDAALEKAASLPSSAYSASASVTDAPEECVRRSAIRALKGLENKTNEEEK